MRSHAPKFAALGLAAFALAGEGCSTFYWFGNTAGYSAVRVPNRVGWRHGPRVTFENYSDADVTIRYWVGRIDLDEPNGTTDWQTPEEVTLAPGACATSFVGRRYWLTAGNDAIVRFQADYVDPPTGESVTEWYEFEPGPPYKAGAHWVEGGGVAFRSAGDSRINYVPEELWIPGNLDEFPVYDVQSADASEG